jgi:hypothetical protein
MNPRPAARAVATVSEQHIALLLTTHAAMSIRLSRAVPSGVHLLNNPRRDDVSELYARSNARWA